MATELNISGVPAIGGALTFDVQLTAPGPALLLVEAQLGPTTLGSLVLDVAITPSTLVLPLPQTGTPITQLALPIPLQPVLQSSLWFVEAVELGPLKTSGARPLLVSPAPPRADGAYMVGLPSLAGSHQNPSWSPGGDELMLTHWAGGYNALPADVYITTLASGTLRAMTTSGQSNVNMPGTT
jgi:hypothetical protein